MLLIQGDKVTLHSSLKDSLLTLSSIRAAGTEAWAVNHWTTLTDLHHQSGPGRVLLPLLPPPPPPPPSPQDFVQK